MPSDPLSAQVHEQFVLLVHRQRRLFQQVLAGHDLHPAQAMCLRVLADRDGVSQRDLAQDLLLSAPTVTRMLQRMERRGLVERAADENDQRVAVVRLTDAGRALGRDVERALGEYLERTVARLPEQDRRDLARLLAAWSQACGDDPTCAAPDPDAAPTLHRPGREVRLS